MSARHPTTPQATGRSNAGTKPSRAIAFAPWCRCRSTTLDDARRLVAQFVEHYNTARLHSAIGYVTPRDKRLGKDPALPEERDRKLAAARERRRAQRPSRQEPRPSARGPDTPAAPTPARRPIDFVAVRSRITLAAVLPRLGFQPRSTHGGQQRGACPLHGSTAGTSRCFSANLHEHVFRCFKCNRSGNARDRWVAATQQPPDDAAIDLCGRLHLDVPYLNAGNPRHREEEPVSSDLPTTCTMSAIPSVSASLTH